MKNLFLILILLPLVVSAAPVNINQADAETISGALEGIGPKKAQAIIQYRTEHGNFESLKDLENVNGIGEKTIKANEKDIIFSDNSSEKPKSEKVSKEAK
ncbi:MAG: helix-hairpin-helix domain-containing protein [Methylomonas sp.]|jgi:competence protein ComEA|uniref:ComEA family DNA-binding protein n=1 Tax=Methylomonas sp. TaxID=418 RepID=UPI0025CD2213|nr:helix-hairpin-helix domain-containing protein [Methylomonas sp.]MCK9609110.1 helix-hairpin-helix domain-containing protein [Methylomonas sp.]